MGYHRRILVETQMPCIKLGSRLADLHLVLPNEVPQLCC